jgi:serine/threonine protein kinase
VGSVFVVCRAEERHEPSADRFALKIPTYDGSVAHTLSEEEFLRLFREEAGALLTLPTHPNLAGFVNFDARARPKPVLVMELVEGPTLERMLERRDLTLPLALSVLDGVAAGLEAMHGLGIGHLDIKPANVILRAPSAMSDSAVVSSDISALPPVLVDFGLAGRKVRPGCASPYYGAPEVWLSEAQSVGGPKAEPPPADVYSYCCLAYELLMGRRLFSGDTLPAVVAAHFEHDGRPAALSVLEDDARLAPVAELLSRGLRADPRQRPSISELRGALDQLAPSLRQGLGGWPVAA